MGRASMGGLRGGGWGVVELGGLGGGAAQNAPVHIWAQVFAAHGMFGLALNGGAVVSGNATRANTISSGSPEPVQGAF